MSVAERLHAAIAAVCPIDGVSPVTSGTSLGPGNVRIDFRAAASAAQRSAAQSAVSGFDWSDAAHQTWLDSLQPDRTALRQAAAQAVSDNNAYLALASPTNAQVLAQVRRLTQEATAIIKRLIQID